MSFPRVPHGWFLVFFAFAVVPGLVKEPPKPELKSCSVLAITAGKTITVVLYGDNLAPTEVASGKPPLIAKLLGVKATEGAAKEKGKTQVTLEVSAPANCPRDTFELVLTHPNKVQVTALIAVVEPVAAELEVKRPNATFGQAMPLTGPSVAVNGALQADTPDRFRFDAKAGETWEITLLAGRVGSAMDAMMRVRDARRISLAFSAGDEKRDRHILFHAVTAGTYYIEISDAENKGGPAYRYRLTLSHKDG